MFFPILEGPEFHDFPEVHRTAVGLRDEGERRLDMFCRELVERHLVRLTESAPEPRAVLMARPVNGPEDDGFLVEVRFTHSADADPVGDDGVIAAGAGLVGVNLVAEAPYLLAEGIEQISFHNISLLTAANWRGAVGC